MSKPTRRTAVRIPSVEEDAIITAAALSDPDAQPLEPSQLKRMTPMRAVRGRPRSPSKKQLISIRYSPEVVEYFKSTGEGWQARIDGVLKAYVGRKLRRASHGT